MGRVCNASTVQLVAILLRVVLSKIVYSVLQELINQKLVVRAVFYVQLVNSTPEMDRQNAPFVALEVIPKMDLLNAEDVSPESMVPP